MRRLRSLLLSRDIGFLRNSDMGVRKPRSPPESEQARNLSGFGVLGLIASRKPPSLWKCWNPASFAGFPSAGGNGGKVVVGLFRGFHGASFPQRTRYYARLGANVVVACRRGPNPGFQKPA